MSSPLIGAIVVTHNSQLEIDACLDSLIKQGDVFTEVVIVDSGSKDTSYLDKYAAYLNLQIILESNVGFSQANNIGFKQLCSDPEYVLFINPDVILTDSFLSTAVSSLAETPNVGLLTGKLLGYDFTRMEPTGLIDSAGIKRKWYGKWYDRGQGEEDFGQYDVSEYIDAVCGALIFASIHELRKGDGNVFDPSFFLYKEDIELSLRIRKDGKRLFYQPKLVAYHGRGWQSSRQEMTISSRITAAESELLLYKRHPSPYVLWALLKYFAVRIFKM